MSRVPWVRVSRACLVAGLAWVGPLSCASPRTPEGPSATLAVEVHNDISPSADLEIFLYPVGGDDHDRVRMGVVQGASTRSFDVPVREGGWYYLRADRVVAIPSVPYPVDRPAVINRWISRRFTMRPDTRTATWRVDTNSLAMGARGSPSP